MIFRISPCIIKLKGSIKRFNNCNYLIRFKGSKIPPPTVRVFAASSSVPHPKQTVKDSKSQRNDVISVRFPSKSGEEEIQQHFKPVVQSDDTISVSEKDRTTTDHKDKVKILNTIKVNFLEWHKQSFDLLSLPSHYKNLSKFRLSGLVVLTTLAGYGMAPGPLEPMAMLSIVLGTGLTSAAANSINQVLEVPYDSQMNRTKNRVLIRGFLSPLHASLFAACSACVGLTTLYLGTNVLTTVLGLTNLILYTSVYTPMKRSSIANTWIGSIVGAIPPLMGWAACMGTLNTSAILMGAILYSWQFPHFNALSWNLRADYSRAGYRMTSVINPDLCRIAALRHSVALLVFCSIAPLANLTSWTFAFDSFPLNCYLIYCSWKFYKEGDSKSARKLFRLSLIYLPALMFLMLIGKKYTQSKEKQDKKVL